MKKFKYLLLLTLLFPFSISASEIDYEITKFNIETTINEDGSADICEYIEQTGTYNGYIRDIKYKSNNDYSASSLTNLKVYDLTKNMQKGTEFTEVAVGNNGDSFIYEKTNSYDQISLKMYNKTNDDKNGYVICYTLNDVILVHNDVAEFYWNFIGEGFDDLLNNVKIKVNLKQKDETLKVWAHGPLYGEVHPYHENISYGLAKIEYINPNTPTDVRMTFSLNNVPYATKKSNKDSLDTILTQEKERAEIANKERQIAKSILIVKISLAVIYFITIISLVIYSYKKYDKERKTTFNAQYLREFPALYGPEVLQYLNEKNVTEKSYSASILEIIRKKGLKVENIEGNNKKYKLVLNTPNEPLTETENQILEFLIKFIGNSKEVELDAIKKYGKTESTARTFLNSYQDWTNSVKRNCQNYNFFEKQKNGPIIAIIIVLTVVTAMLEMSDYVAIGVIVIITGIAATIYEATIKKRTENGALEYQKWKAFKRFLEDFGRFDEKELPEIALWERYLVYASVLGVADKLQKQMQIKINQMNANSASPDLTDIYIMNNLLNANIGNTITSTVNNAVNTSRATIAASEASSGSGSGGGFSSGGGFGGGGGGGRGF